MQSIFAGVPADKNSVVFGPPNPKNIKLFHFAGVPEWSNGIASRALGLVPTQVRILSPAPIFLLRKIIDEKTSVRCSPAGETSLRTDPKIP